MQYNGWNYQECNDWVSGRTNIYPSWLRKYDSIKIKNPDGIALIAVDTDWIVKYNDVFFIMSNYEFNMRYNLA